MHYLNMTVCSVLPKKNEFARSMVGLRAGDKAKRHPVVIIGSFLNKPEFNKALRKALRDEDGDTWDLRTVKFHDSIGFPTASNNGNRIIALECLYEEA